VLRINFWSLQSNYQHPLSLMRLLICVITAGVKGWYSSWGNWTSGSQCVLTWLSSMWWATRLPTPKWSNLDCIFTGLLLSPVLQKGQCICLQGIHIWARLELDGSVTSAQEVVLNNAFKTKPKYEISDHWMNTFAEE